MILVLKAQIFATCADARTINYEEAIYHLMQHQNVEPFIDL